MEVRAGAGADTTASAGFAREDARRMTHASTDHNGPAAIISAALRAEGTPTDLLARLLEVQARIGGASAGVILRLVSQRDADVLAVWPPTPVGARSVPLWIARAAEAAPQVVRDARPVSLGQAPGAESSRLELVPLASLGETHGVAAFLVPDGAAEDSLQRLELATAVLGLHQLRLDPGRRQAEAARLARAIDVAAGVGEGERFRASAMALVGEVAARWRAERASLGMVRPGRAAYVRLEAVSGVEKIVRKMQLVRDLESAMEECVDQDVEVVFPAPEDAPIVAREARELSERHGPASILSLPLRRASGPAGALTIERAPDDPFVDEEVETLRLVLELVSARLAERHDADRWFGARLASSARRGLSRLLGPEHTWIKAAVLALGAFILATLLVRGTDYAPAQAVIEPATQRIVPAPFDGYLSDVHVEVGDEVVAGQTLLAELDDSTLRLELSEARAQLRSQRTQADAARSDGRIAEAQIAEAQADEIAARIRLLEHRIQQASIVAPASGVILSGDLERLEGAPVRQGQALFQIAPPGALVAELQTPEARIGDVEVGQRAEVSVASAPGTRIPIVIRRIEPMAAVADGRNVFRVEAAIDDAPAWLRPGMEGVARIDVGSEPLAYLWTRGAVNWLRTRLWF